jgi:hypothetical protein
MFVSTVLRVANRLVLSAAVVALFSPVAFAQRGGHGGNGGVGAHVSGGGGVPKGTGAGVNSFSGREGFSGRSSFDGGQWQDNIGRWDGSTGHWDGSHAWWGGGRDWQWYGYGWRPWYSFGWWPGYDSYSYYSYPQNDDYGGDYGTPFVTEHGATDTSANDQQSDFYQQALDAFHEGNFNQTARLASHAAIDEPRNADVHTLLMLSLFASGEFRGAAMQAHVLAAMGQIPDWPKLFSFYGTVEPYTEQLRTLEKFVRENRNNPDGVFLLGFQYMMEGHRAAAQNEFVRSLEIMPQDRMAANMLTRVGGKVPAEIARRLSQGPMQGTQGNIQGSQGNTQGSNLPAPPSKTTGPAPPVPPNR